MFKKSNIKKDSKYLQEENDEFNYIFSHVCSVLHKRTTTSTDELLKIGKMYIKNLTDVIPYDLYEPLKPTESVIMNTDDSTKDGEHWTALYCLTPNEFIFFDSYGYPYNDNIPKLKQVLEKAHKKTDINIFSTKSIRQHGDLTYCGQMSLSFLIYLNQQLYPTMALVI